MTEFAFNPEKQIGEPKCDYCQYEDWSMVSDDLPIYGHYCAKTKDFVWYSTEIDGIQTHGQGGLSWLTNEVQSILRGFAETYDERADWVNRARNQAERRRGE